MVRRPHRQAREAQIRNGLSAEFAAAAPALEAAATTTKARVSWLDGAKGIGIVAVVIGHTLGGLIDAPAFADPPVFRAIFLAIYIVHMPLFFLLAGILVQQRIARSQRRFGVDLLRSVMWPYFLWSAAQYSVIFASGSLVNSPVGQYWRALLRLPFATVSQFWFLYVLFFLHLTALVIVPRLGGRGLLLLSLIGKLVPALVLLPALPRLYLIHGGFYALGVWLGLNGVEQVRTKLKALPYPTAMTIAAALVAVVLVTGWTIMHNGNAVWTHSSSDIAAMAWRLPTVPASLLGIAAAILIAMTLKGRAAQIFAYLGRASMAIFVLHVLFVAGVRIVLTRLFHTHDAIVLLATGVTVGLCAPLLVYSVTRRFGWSRALGLGA